MIITIFLKRYYFGTIMNCKKSLFMACWAAMAATAQAQITIHPVEQQLSTADDHVMLTVPPYSLNIVTIKTS